MKVEYKLLEFETNKPLGSIYVTDKIRQADLSDKMYEFAGQKCKFFGEWRTKTVSGSWKMYDNPAISKFAVVQAAISQATKNFAKLYGIGADLNEIGYLSTRSQLIIGRSSGPYGFCQNKHNLYTSPKDFISFCYNKNCASFVHDIKTNATITHSSATDVEEVYNVIASHIR